MFKGASPVGDTTAKGIVATLGAGTTAGRAREQRDARPSRSDRRHGT